jgi:hypothetical protein
MFIAAIVGYAIAIVLVEKQNEWPATMLRPPILWILGRIYHKLPDMLFCTVCTSFWAALFADIGLGFYTKWKYIPCWPISGFLAIALSWTIIQLFNAIDPPKPK